MGKWSKRMSCGVEEDGRRTEPTVARGGHMESRERNMGRF